MIGKFALFTIAAIGLGAASIGTPAQAAPPGAGYGGIYPHAHGGWNGGWRGGGYRGGGWRGGGWHRRGYYGGGWGWGAPLYGFYGAPYAYDDGYIYCRYRKVRIHTPYGWRWGRRRVCW